MTPQAIRTLMRSPGQPVASPFLGHLPAFLWTIEVLRPRCFVQAGLSDPAPFLIACEIMTGFAAEAECHGLGLASLPAESAAAVRAQAETLALGAASLAEGSLLQAAAALPEGSVDLLLLDLATEGVTEVDWSPVLSRRSVVLAYGASGEPAAWEALAPFVADRPRLLQTSGKGLAIVLHGSELPAALRAVADPPGDRSVQAALLERFAEQAVLVQSEQAAAATRRRVAAVLERVRSAKADQVVARKEAETLRKKLDALHSAYDLRSSRAADLEARLFDARQHLAKLQAEIDEGKTKVATKLAARDAALANMRQKLAAMTTDAKRRDRELADMVKRLQATERRLGNVLASRSWALTAPVRRVIGRLRKRG